MTELNTMKNIGKEMERKLKSVGIYSAEDLIRTGSKQTFLNLRLCYPNVCLVHLYTLQGAIDDIEFNDLPQEVKSDLKCFSNGLKL